MQLLENVELKNYTSFYIGGQAKRLLYAQTDEEVIEGLKLAEKESWPIFIFGGGSNVLINDKGFDGLAIRIETVGIDIDSETDQSVILKIASGEVWDDVVRFAVDQNWWGIENLSHIPGFVGAYAVQNVGAYGQEASQVIVKVDCYDRQTNQLVTLSNKECGFSYRRSIFNSTEKDRYVILSTYIQLSKKPEPNLQYRDLADKFKQNHSPSITEIRESIILIRDLKFPFPSTPIKGNAGSFFRGPILQELELDKLSQLLAKNFDIETAKRLETLKPKLQVPGGFKTPAAFLLDICGLKGLVLGGVRINETQPAVIVNYSGNGTAAEVLALYVQARDVVLQQTGVALEFEPELIGFSSEEQDLLTQKF